MASDATIRRVARPRGELTAQQVRAVQRYRRAAEYTQEEYRWYCVQLLADGCSFAEVSKVTGLSTNTLQRWKREAR